jgi:hypothetical protein
MKLCKFKDLDIGEEFKFPSGKYANLIMVKRLPSSYENGMLGTLEKCELSEPVYARNRDAKTGKRTDLKTAENIVADIEDLLERDEYDNHVKLQYIRFAIEGFRGQHD